MPLPAPPSLRLLAAALLLGPLLFGCARRQGAAPAPVAPAEEPAPLPLSSEPAARPELTPDPAACKEARAQLKDLTDELADGCSDDNPCIVDHDCLVRTAGADASSVREARMAMENLCSPAGTITRLSCVESPAPCQAGRCVARPVRR